MKKSLMIAIAAIAIVCLFGMVSCSYVLNLLNTEVDLKTAIGAKQKDNTSEYDNMWKKIAQVAQVTDAQKAALLEIFTGYAEARSGQNSNHALASWIHESVPNVDTSTFNNLQNIITSSRDSWTMRQKELIGISQEHNKLLQKPVSRFFLVSIFNKQQIGIQIVTSSKTEESFVTGKDDNVDVFKK